MRQDSAELGCSTHQQKLRLGEGKAKPGCSIWWQKPRQEICYAELSQINHSHAQDWCLGIGVVVELNKLLYWLWFPLVITEAKMGLLSRWDMTAVSLGMGMDVGRGVPGWTRFQQPPVFEKIRIGVGWVGLSLNTCWTSWELCLGVDQVCLGFSTQK